MADYVNICGIPHKVEYVDDVFDTDMHLGQVDYDLARIKLNKKASEAVQKEALCHEILHAILVHIGRQDLNEEPFVQALANAVNQTFEVKEG